MRVAYDELIPSLKKMLAAPTAIIWLALSHVARHLGRGVHLALASVVFSPPVVVCPP